MRHIFATRPVAEFQDYTASHLGAGEQYQRRFESNPGRALMWDLEQAALRDLIGAVKPRRALDFACGTGRIVNLSSIAGKEGNPNGSAYAAAKGGVIAYTKSISKELAQSGVLVNCVAPTMAETDLLKQMTPEFIASIKAKIPMRRLMEVEELAAMVAWIASADCSFTTGFTFDLTGGRATY